MIVLTPNESTNNTRKQKRNPIESPIALYHEVFVSMMRDVQIMASVAMVKEKRKIPNGETENISSIHEPMNANQTIEPCPELKINRMVTIEKTWMVLKGNGRNVMQSICKATAKKIKKNHFPAVNNIPILLFKND